MGDLARNENYSIDKGARYEGCRMNEEELTQQLLAVQELAKHLATREDVLLLKIDIQRLRVELIPWIIGTNFLVASTVVTAMLYLTTHWKP